MKKFIYLCGMMLLCMDMMAQIDNNWTLVIDDDFHDFIGWNENTFIELNRNTGYQAVWECFMKEWYSGVTTGENKHQAYQTSHAFLNNDDKMTLMAQFISATPLDCGIDYAIPSNKVCTDNEHTSQHLTIYYFSGTIESLQKYWFGYYEINCTLPVHDGEGAAFWLFGTGPNSYEEIDIFEHSYCDSSHQLDKGFSCGIWYNPDGIDYDGAHNTIKSHYIIEDNEQNLVQEHTYACEWLPDRITWLFDGKVIFECVDRNEIPQHPMWLKVSHPVDNNALRDEEPFWCETDSLTISRIKYYKLEFDCDSDVLIDDVNDITNYEPGVKHSISIASSSGLTLPSTSNVSFRANSSITIDGDFTVPIGAQMTMIIQDCPEL